VNLEDRDNPDYVRDRDIWRYRDNWKDNPDYVRDRDKWGYRNYVRNTYIMVDSEITGETEIVRLC